MLMSLLSRLLRTAIWGSMSRMILGPEDFTFWFARKSPRALRAVLTALAWTGVMENPEGGVVDSGLKAALICLRLLPTAVAAASSESEWPPLVRSASVWA